MPREMLSADGCFFWKKNEKRSVCSWIRQFSIPEIYVWTQFWANPSFRKVWFMTKSVFEASITDKSTFENLKVENRQIVNASSSEEIYNKPSELGEPFLKNSLWQIPRLKTLCWEHTQHFATRVRRSKLHFLYRLEFSTCCVCAGCRNQIVFSMYIVWTAIHRQLARNSPFFY